MKTILKRTLGVILLLFLFIALPVTGIIFGNDFIQVISSIIIGIILGIIISLSVIAFTYWAFEL